MTDDFFLDADRRLSSVETMLKNLFRIGKVVGHDEKKCRCRVQFEDNDGIVSYWCQVMVRLSHNKKEYGLPPINSEVGCIFLPFGHEAGFIMGSPYNDKDPVPSGACKDAVIFEDEGGNREEWNSASQTHLMRSSRHLIEGDVEITGNLVVSGTITDGVGNLTNHTNEGYTRDVGS